MSEKPKCSIEGCERNVLAKGLCSGHYGKQWREQRQAERVVEAEPKQLTAGEPLEAEVIPADVPLPQHLIATSPAEMQAAQGDFKVWLEQKLMTIEREIVEVNAALNEARRNGWSTTALTMARNRAV